jgi:hypothetical protein
MQGSKNDTPKSTPILLDPAKVGASLKEVGVDYQEIESKQVETRWFRDKISETDIFVWMSKDRKMIKQQVSVMGLLTEWNILDGVRTGVVLESELSAQDLMQSGLTPDDTASEVIHFDKDPQQRTLDISISILKNMTCVEPELKELMLRQFNQGVGFSRGSSQIESKDFWRLPLLTRVKNFFLSCFKK